MNAIEFTIDKPKAIEFSFEDIHITIGGDRYPEYGGSYTVIPRVYSQTLNTYHTSMEQNMNVTEIPKQSATNPGGGYTVTIG